MNDRRITPALSTLRRPVHRAYAKLAEECAEVVHAFMKCERHGYRNCHPETGVINETALEAELADLREALDWVDCERRGGRK